MPPSHVPPPIIVTGCPLSGTSVIAQALFRAGLFMGDSTGPLHSHDPSGFFTDADIAPLHASALAEAGKGPDGAKGHPGDAKLNREETATILGSRRLVSRPWGWKDSATVHFLDQWDILVPDARWIFLYRDPAIRAWSVLRRSALRETAKSALPTAMEALREWTAINRRILRYIRKKGERCLLLYAPRDFDGTLPGMLDAVIRDTWRYPLKRVDLRQTYRPYLMEQRAPGWLTALGRFHRPSREILKELHRAREHLLVAHFAADNEGPASPLTQTSVGKPKRTICLALNGPCEYSQTFVHDHIRLLPAEVRLVSCLGSAVKGGQGPSLLSPGERIADSLLSSFACESTGPANRALRRYFRKNGIQAVLAEFGQTGVRVAEACRQAGVPLVVHFHGYDAYSQDVLRLYGEAYRSMFRTAAAIIVVSRDMERQLAALGAPPEKIHWNPCGVDTEAFSRADPGSAPPHFLSVGRFVDKKSPHLTMLAFRTVLEEIPESRLTMAGGGSLRESSMEICEALGMGGRVDFPGILSREEVAAAMSRSRCFVQHSRVTKFGDSEGTPVAVLEAGASCLPAVVTCHAGFAEAVVEGKTGFLVKEGDYRSMGRRMLELARDPALARTMGVAARERIRRIYDFDRRIPRLWEILLKAIEARPGQSQ